MGSNPRITGGGLIRGLGGWSEVVAARRRETKADQRILGMGDFVNAVLKEAEERHQRPLRAQHSGKKVAHLVHEECLKHGMSTEELREGSRRIRVSQGLGQSSQQGLFENLGLPPLRLRQVVVNTSSVSRAIMRTEGGAGEQ
jgi:hypothetical protein